MKRDDLLDDVSARALDFAWFRDALAPASAYGERVYERTPPFAPGEEAAARARADRIAQIAASVSGDSLDAMREIFRDVPDAAGAIARASMGDPLSDANFLELQRFFDACMRFDALRAGVEALPLVATDALRRCALRLELGRSGKFGYYLADGFAPDLAKARAALGQSQAEYDAIRGRSSARVAAALGREISGEEFIVMRADIPDGLPAGVRVIREAPTYVLCALDADDATLAALERRESFALAVASAEERVRAELTEFVRAQAAALGDAAESFGVADVLVAAARFTRMHACVPADIVAEPALEVEEACFIPLALALEREGRRFTRISVSLRDVAVLTGPNMGGKSVCLRTCGSIALCAAFGVPVPAARARVGLFREIAWLGVGADDRDEGLLSSFAREVVRLRDVLSRGHAPLLVLMDEFARTTTPVEGKALLVAVLQHFTAHAARGLAATHLAGVAAAASVAHYAVRGLRGIPDAPATSDLREALETLAASMDYTVEEVSGGTEARSDAIALAALLGLDATVVADAYHALTAQLSG